MEEKQRTEEKSEIAFWVKRYRADRQSSGDTWTHSEWHGAKSKKGGQIRKSTKGGEKKGEKDGCT